MADLFTADESGGHVAAELSFAGAGEVRGGSAGNNFVTGFSVFMDKPQCSERLTDENRRDDYAERNSSTSRGMINSASLYHCLFHRIRARVADIGG